VPRVRRRGLIALVVTFAALLAAGAASAATITVNTTGDPGPKGTTSLRQAIAAAGSGATVSVPAGHYTLKGGQITIAQPITVAGAGASSTVVDGNNAGGIFKVTGNGMSTIENLGLTRGHVNVTASNEGGAAVDNERGPVTLRDDSFTDNAVTGGGGFDEGGGAVFNDAAAMTIAGSYFQGNTVTLSGGPSDTELGGGAAYDNGAGITMTGTALTGNSATVAGPAGNNGGGAYYENATGLTVTSSSFIANKLTVTGGGSEDGGGGLYDDGGGIKMSGSTVTGNSASLSGVGTDNGGGAYFEDAAGLKAADTAFTNNSLNVESTGGDAGAGALFDDGGGLGLTNVSVTGNSATVSGSAATDGGGGVLDVAAGVTAVNVTLSDNSASVPSGPDNGGGGLLFTNGPGKLTNTTIARNSTNRNSGAIMNTGGGASFKSSLIAGNSAANGHDCDTSGAPFTSAGNNLEDKTPTTCGLTGAGDLVGANPKLAPLANNGGPGPTNALLAGSPAIDHIAKAQCTDQQGTPAPVSTDERGVPRGLDGFCDIGAYETAPADLGLSARAAPSKLVASQRSTVTFTVSDAGPAPATNAKLTLNVHKGLKLLGSNPVPVGTVTTAGTRVTVSVEGVKAGKHSLSATVSATEADPRTANNSASTSVTVKPLKLSKLKVKHKRVSFKLNAGASVKFTLETCTGKKCKKLKSFKAHGKAGTNKVKLKKLKAGRYKLIATPVAAGVKGRKVSVKFRVK
jgi:Domain of unknown function DUF11